ncbi:slx4p interacting protein [Aspergillus brasiliensis]|uniref:Slx4p interacting protein n=1 Tax=Aspergillus brasiliensis TaxID=319629 RepID=A0A9W5YNZ9_9EURO|nr:slx4p interacting protein [Aspergillus brasiliensis]GKZ43161.1 slx4p interacting protein [Aspergillus brasiliensis]
MDDAEVDHTKPIPAYYCCYLLRSTKQRTSLYIGSTPHPARRLAQHNGDSKGGARKTAKDDKRPWEMVLLVEGFTSRVAALQFEWAWQNPKMSSQHPANRHQIDLDTGDAADSSGVQPSTEAGKAKHRGRGSRRSLKAHLEDLHLFLRSTYFSKWPLKLRFFNKDVYQLWTSWCDRVDALLPDHIRTILDGDCPKEHLPRAEEPRVRSVEHVKVDYSHISDYVEKSHFLLDDPSDLRCNICQAKVVLSEELAVVCPQASCYCISHLVCLSFKFLEHAEEPDQLVPIDGNCPLCDTVIQWSTMMQELSLRTRGQNESRLILRKAKRGRGKAAGSNLQTSAPDGVVSAVENPGSQVACAESASVGVSDCLDMDHHDDVSLDENWTESLDLDPYPDEPLDRPKVHNVESSRVEIIIDDSDCEEMEELG